MKWLFLVALLAMGVSSAEVVLEDNSGDVEATVTNWNDLVDLVGLEIEELEDEILFRLEIADTATSPDLLFVTSANYNVFMKYGENDWGLQLFRNVNFDGSVFWGGNLRPLNQDGGGQFSFGRSIFVELDGNTIVASVPRGALSNEDDQQLSRGRTLENVYVASSARQINFADQRPVEASDRMPDSGLGPNWEAKLGPRQDGPAILISDKAYRGSNGEATTYAFEVQLSSPEARELDLRVDNVPAGWNIILPVSTIDSEFNGTIPVLAQVPFRHDHGVTETFSLIGENGEDYTELLMGVHYLDPAEISGHHPKSYLHSFFGGQTNFNDVLVIDFSFGMMTTEELDAQATGVPVYSNGGSTFCDGVGVSTCEQFYYYAPIDNGFDANVDEQGSLSFQVDFPVTVLEAQAFVTLTHQRFDGTYSEEPIFQGTSSLLGQSNGVTDVFVNLDALPYADRIEVARSQSLELEIELRYQGVQQPIQLGDDSPLRVGITSGEIELPLNDFHDDVSAYFDGIPSLKVNLGMDTSTVNNDETRLFPVELENIGSKVLDLHLQLDGKWATLLGGETVKLAGGESKTIYVSVSPVGAVHGDATEAILTIHGEGSQEIVTLKAIVTDIDVPDDAEIAAEFATKETPWPLAIILPALAVAWPRRQVR